MAAMHQALIAGYLNSKVSAARTDTYANDWSPAEETITWSGCNFGPADPSRVMVFGINGRRPSASSGLTTMTACSISGIPATFQQVETRNNTGTSERIGTFAIAYAPVPTGNSGNVTFTFDPNIFVLIVHAFSIIGSNGAPYQIVMPTTRASSHNISQDTIPGASVVGFGASVEPSAGSDVGLSWTGLGSSLQTNRTDGGNNRASLSSAFESELAVGSTPLTIIESASNYADNVGNYAASLQFRAY